MDIVGVVFIAVIVSTPSGVGLDAERLGSGNKQQDIIKYL